MIGPVSNTGRAMMASLQQAVAKGMPADQAVAYVKSMAQQGVAPLVDLYAMLNQFQRLKQPQVQAPQTPPTIKDQINMAAQQQAVQQAMSQGLGGMDAGTMENPQFAGGGIIAFQSGGQAPAPENAGLQGLIDLIKKRFGEDETEYVSREAEQRRAMRERMKLGEYGEAAAERQRMLDEQDKERARYEQELNRANMMQFFADLSERGAQPGATFLGSLAGAGGTLGKGRAQAAKDLREMDAMRREARLKMLEAKELRREGDITGAEQAYEQGQNLMLGIQQKSWELGEGRKTAIAQAKAQRSPVADIQGSILNRMVELQKSGQAGTDEYKQLANLYQGSFPQVAAVQVRGSLQENKYLKSVHDDLMKKRRDISSGYGTDSKEYLAADKELKDFRAYLESKGIDVGPEDTEAMGVQDPLGIRINPRTGMSE